MRKSNSEFKTAFVSEAGGELANNDYFAYVELDDYACYVVAAGITDFHSSEAARLAVEHLILNFEENPSLSRSVIKRCLQDANQRLIAQGKQERLKASILMLVTDYADFRYGAAGDIRLRVYRKGRLFLRSADMSLAQQLLRHKKTETVLEEHEERHNLYAYLGKRDSFSPFVSDKFKLQDADILALYTGGFWEHVDAGEIDDIFREASNEPQESIDTLEDLLLSRQPAQLKSYTIATIFVNKTYRDPERERKRRLYLKIAIITFIIILIVALIAFLIYKWHQHKVEKLNATEVEVVDFLHADNYARAQASCQDALEQAKDLRRTEDEDRMRRYLVLIDSILRGDELFQAKDYLSAMDVYMTGLDNSREADLMGMSYLERRISQTEGFIYVTDFIALGDKVMAAGDLDRAEAIYYKARDKAALANDKEGRQAAMDALDRLYDERTKQLTDTDKKQKEKSDAAINDAVKQGDELLAKGDIEGAEKAYLEARAIASASGDKAARADAMNSLQSVRDAKNQKKLEENNLQDERNRQYAQAVEAGTQGDKAYMGGDFISAQVYYQSAAEKFLALDESKRAAEMQQKAEAAQMKQQQGMQQQQDAQAAEKKAQELYSQKDFEGAKTAATKAKQLYTVAGNSAKVDEMTLLLQQIDLDAVIEKNMK
ncbi:MAG: protein phosphatase [Selenomonadaceae bacterium]|nr:protein phosphatase [Selenomonadaceae bacterium]